MTTTTTPANDPIVTVQIGRSTWQGPLSQAPKVPK